MIKIIGKHDYPLYYSFKVKNKEDILEKMAEHISLFLLLYNEINYDFYFPVIPNKLELVTIKNCKK